jgi:hypothetical protein
MSKEITMASVMTRREWLLTMGLLAGACREAPRSATPPEAPVSATVTLAVSGMV